MRVLQVITSLDKDCGGPSRSLPTMCVGLKNINVCCDILTYQSPNPNTDALMESGVKVLLAENETNLWDKYLSQSFVKSLNADVNIIHIHNLWSWPLHRVATFARKNSIPLVWSPRGTLEPWSLKQKKIKKYLALFFYQRADLRNAFCIHATAEEEADNIRKLGFKNPIAVIPNEINVLNYPLKTWVKKKKRILAFLSRIHPKKGIELLLEAWSRMPSEILGTWKVRIAGEGDVKVAMGEKVTTWGTPSNDRLQDFLLSVENFYIENVKAKKTQQEMVEGFRVFLQKQVNANLNSPVSAYILATYRSRFIAEDYTLFKNKIVADYRKLLE